MTKISALPADSSPTVTDYIPAVDTETTITKKVLVNDLVTLIASQLIPTGMLTEYGGFSAPNGWLFSYGQDISRTTYANLFAALVPSLGTFTVTIATPGVFTLASHGLMTGDAVYLTTTGALPTGLTANTIYYAIKIDANTFNLATSRANAYASTKIATSGSQSGTHTLRACPYGLGDGSTTFNCPDMRGRVGGGNDSMGGTAASRLTAFDTTNGVYGNLGAGGGLEKHTLTTAQLASHTHQISTALAANGTKIASASGSDNNGNASGMSAAGSDAAHNNTQPTTVVNFIIKT